MVVIFIDHRVVLIFLLNPAIPTSTIPKNRMVDGSDIMPINGLFPSTKVAKALVANNGKAMAIITVAIEIFMTFFI
jgi:hypothetical protein